LISQLLVLSKSEFFIRIDNIVEMMRYLSSLGSSRLSGADIHKAVDLTAVGIDDFTFESLRQINCQPAFSSTGRSQNRN